jgi:hypothetical protein
MRMRKTGWTALGLLGLSLLMCGSAEAQTADTGGNPNANLRSGEPPSQPALEDSRPANPAAASNAQAGGGEADLRRTVSRLQWEVAQLRADVAELRARLGEQQGVGGAGTAGQAGTGGTGQAGTGTAEGEVGGTSVATANYSGTVQEVGPQAIVIGDETGALLTLDVDRNTRVLRGDGRRMGVQQLQLGTRVNVAVDLLADGRNEAIEITVQPTR